MSSQLQNLYAVAKTHKDNHRGCGGEPYKNYEKLFSIVKNYINPPAAQEEINVLELGTAIGFTSIVIYKTIEDIIQKINLNFNKKENAESSRNINIQIDTIDTHTEHNKIAKSWVKEEVENFGDINVIQADIYKILPYLESEKYNIVFFDVYGPKEKFVDDFYRILKVGGILISTNSHLKSADIKYFQKLESRNVNELKWELLEEFEDTKVYKKCAIL